jgi:hypothetical protein
MLIAKRPTSTLRFWRCFFLIFKIGERVVFGTSFFYFVKKGAFYKIVFLKTKALKKEKERKDDNVSNSLRH